MHFEFVLPNVDFGLGDLRTTWVTDAYESFIIDKLEFTLEERTWVLRKLVKFADGPCPVDVAAALAAKANVTFKLPQLEPICVLQVPGDGWDLAPASEMATDICWMLQVALGQRVVWNQVGQRVGGKFSLQSARSVNAPTAANRSGPIQNAAAKEIRAFLEAFYPIYRQNTAWWKVTADWFAIARGSNIVEVEGLVASMLLDRVTLFCLKKHNFPKQIEDAPKTDLTEDSDGRLAFEKQIDALVKASFSDKWTKSRALVGKIKEWNDQPSYEKKVETVFKKYGLEPPSETALKNRSALAHGGELSSKTKDIGAYHDEIVETITTLLLKMANYRGPYFVPGAGIRQM